MEIIKNRGIDKKSRLTNNSAALGNFDGIHLGHLELLRTINEYKEKNNSVKSCVFTFEEHTQNIIKSSFHVMSITTAEEKAVEIEKAGVDYLILQDFNYVRNMEPETFVDKVLVDFLGCVFVAVGFNFRFGKNASGTPAMLEELLFSRRIGFKMIPPVIVDDIAVSSSFIRSLINIGDMEKVKKFLGRPFSIDFPVVYGKQIGRRIGVPTINQIFPEGHIIPAVGIYACTCEICGTVYRAVTNIGTRPTIGGDFLNSETHIIGYSGDLYGENIKVSFHQKFRDEIKFNNLDELQLQIKKDIEYAKSCEI